MRIDSERLKKICKKRGLGLTQLLQTAGVSRTAYYSLVRKPTLLPKSVLALAEALDVPPSTFLEESPSELIRIRELQQKLKELVRKYPNASRENMWHTLLLLEEPPIERLKRGLIRGRKIDIH